MESLRERERQTDNGVGVCVINRCGSDHLRRPLAPGAAQPRLGGLAKVRFPWRPLEWQWLCGRDRGRKRSEKARSHFVLLFPKQHSCMHALYRRLCVLKFFIFIFFGSVTRPDMHDLEEQNRAHYSYCVYSFSLFFRHTHTQKKHISV